ncbi:proteolipid protein 2 [Sarcophilus harrisii]|uniref:proteolipid protein 2 n=1 Tax=Sarcophilus harrisii TaxID=9305 RepID=UPI001301A5FB|nr:proteolipid protein 2 [Sarcophilus harrisii]
MADSERGAAPDCSAACSAFSRTRKGFYLGRDGERPWGGRKAGAGRMPGAPAGRVLCLVIFICYSASRVAGYLSVPVVEMVLAAVFFAIFMFNVHHQLQFINWPWTDFFRALLFLSSSSSPHSSPSSETRMLRAQWEG